MTDLTFENAVRTAQTKAQKEITVSTNTLEKFWKPEPFSGGTDMKSMLGPISSKEVPLGRLGTGSSRTTGENYAGRNRPTPDTDEPVWRRRSSQSARQGREVGITCDRTQAQLTGISFEKLVDILKDRMVDAYNYDMLAMMINGFTMPMRENPVMGGLGSGGGSGDEGKGFEVKFLDSFRHMMVGKFTAAQNKKGTYEAPFTIDGLDYIDSEMANCRDAGYLNPADRSQSPIDLETGNPSDTHVYDGSNPRLGDAAAEAERIVVMGHTAFARFKEENRDVLSRSELFHDRKNFLGHAYVRRYDKYMFVSVPDALASNRFGTSFPDPLTWQHAANPVMSAVPRSGAERGRIDFVQKASNTSGRKRFRVRALVPGGEGVGLTGTGGSSSTWRVSVVSDSSSAAVTVRKGNTVVDDFTFTSLAFNLAQSTGQVVFRGKTVEIVRIQAGDLYPENMNFQDPNTVDTVKDKAKDFRSDTTKNASAGAQNYNGVSGNALLHTNERFADASNLSMAYIVDRRAMHYGLPKEMNVKFKIAEDFQNSHNYRLYSEIYLDTLRLYDPLVRQVFFTRSGDKIGTYTTA